LELFIGNLEIDRTSIEPHFILALASLEQLSFDRTRSSQEMAPGRHWVSHNCEQSGTRQYL